VKKAKEEKKSKKGTAKSGGGKARTKDKVNEKERGPEDEDDTTNKKDFMTLSDVFAGLKEKLGEKQYDLFSLDIIAIEKAIFEKYGRAADSNDMLEFVDGGLEEILTTRKDAQLIGGTLKKVIAAGNRVLLGKSFNSTAKKAFSAEVRYRDGMCVVTGSKIDADVEAAHLWPIEREDDLPEGNILDTNLGFALRKNLHAGFDSFLWAINPQTCQVEWGPHLRDAGKYIEKHGEISDCEDGKILKYTGGAFSKAVKDGTPQFPTKVILERAYKNFKDAQVGHEKEKRCTKCKR